jgi:hypothetical protein
MKKGASMSTPQRKPDTIQGDLHHLPAGLQPLTSQRQWVLWDWEWRTNRKGEGRWTKPPLSAAFPPNYASASDPLSWSDYATALRACDGGHGAGIGFALKEPGIAAFDLDHCRDPRTGAVLPVAMAIVVRAGTYCEITVSGTGLRIIGKACGGEVHRKYPLGANGASIELYRAAPRYITISGNPLPGTVAELADIDAVIDAVKVELDGRGHKGEDGDGDEPAGECGEGDRLDAPPSSPAPGLDLPDDLVKLIEEGPEPTDDHSGKFHHVVARMGDLGWNDTAIKERIGDHPIVPERYLDRLLKEIRRCLSKRRNVRFNEAVERLASLRETEYDQSRKAEARRLGMRVGTLDKAVARKRARRAQEKTGDANGRLIETINKDHALAIVGNKAVIMRFQPIPLDNGSYVPGFAAWNVETFKLWTMTLPPVETGEGSFVSAADYWLMNKGRREYRGIEFEPGEGKGRDGFFNLWKGFTVEPSRKGGGSCGVSREASCAKFLAHIRDNVALGNEEHYRWIVGWWAAIFQKPDVKVGTALVIRGKKGTGKSKIGEVFGSLLGEHYLQVVNSRYIGGNFNSHMAALVVLHADEAFWAGDKASVGVLNHLVTGASMMLEFKRVDPIRVRNFIRLYVCGNPDWIVPSGMRERRWGIFDIGEDHIQDNAYFAAIDEEMDNGGREALLQHLLEFDLSSVDLNRIPQTEALLDQQIEGLTPLQSWWMEVLSKGVLPNDSVKGKAVCERRALHEHYLAHANLHLDNHRSTETKLGFFLRRMFQRGRKNLLHEYRPRVVGFDKSSVRPRCLQFPPLRRCREMFAEDIGQPLDWGEEWQAQNWRKRFETARSAPEEDFKDQPEASVETVVPFPPKEEREPW